MLGLPSGSGTVSRDGGSGAFGSLDETLIPMLGFNLSQRAGAAVPAGFIGIGMGG